MDEYNFLPESKYFFAVDLGATSGRTILGVIENGKIDTEELTRFDNLVHHMNGHYYWNIYSLYTEIIKGLKKVAKMGKKLESIGIDTWGVDFLCVGKDGEILRNPRSYRDPCTFDAMEDYFQNVMSQKDLYMKTGIQTMNFNTIFQLYAMKQHGNTAYESAETFLFVPDALSYLLTGEKVCEYSVASTAGMLNPYTREFDEDLLKSVGIKREQFGRMVMPGEKIGCLTKEIQKETGLGDVPVIAVAGHDTASAVAAVPATTADFAYLSSGTWSLMGIESPEPIISEETYEMNFTNEGGVNGTIRFLKNICGMWLLESCRREWGDSVPRDHQALIAAAMNSEQFRSIIYPDSPRFANPDSMVTAIQEYCAETGQYIPETYGEICRCIFDSLALRYKEVFEYLCETSGKKLDVLHIIGGGSLNQYLNQITADACNVKVLAGPVEGTALGNIMVQALAAGEVADLAGMRYMICHSGSPKEFNPRNADIWGAAFDGYMILKDLVK